MSPRRWTYLGVGCGLCFGLLPLILDMRLLCLVMGLKAIGVILNGPGLLLLSATLGIGWARTLPGRLLAAALTVVLVEPVLRWIESPAQVNPPDTAERPPQAAKEVTRRSFLVLGAGCSGLALTAGYGALYERTNYDLQQYLLGLPDLPSELEGLRVLLMADWHCGPVVRPGALAPAVELANRCKPDLMLLPGDFVSVDGKYFAEAAELASQLRPRITGGVLISWGNHDHWHGLEAGLRQLPAAGCQVLDNSSLVLTRRRELQRQGSGLWLAGIDDLWAGQPDFLGTLASLPAEQPRLLLAHNPDSAEELQGARVDVMLSGHTHGGQIWIPGLGTPVVPSNYGQKYASGWVQGPNYPVYVTRGVGTATIPVRLGVPPELTLFELRRATAAQLAPARLV